MEDEPRAIVALVCSAGGLAAVRDVLGALPADLAAAVLVLQHLSPDRPSMLPELVAAHSSLKVMVASDGARLESGVVLTAPSAFHCLVTPQLRISLIGSGPYPPYRPSADLLLTTLALAAGPRVIAVVMTGAGHDGATGAAVVQEHGGLVIATDEATSTNFAMPAATIGRIDVQVVALQDLPGALSALVRSAVRD